MGLGHFALGGGCGCGDIDGCSTGYETSYEDQFNDTDPVDPDWIQSFAGGRQTIFEHVNGLFTPVQWANPVQPPGSFPVGRQARAHRLLAVDYTSATKIEQSVKAYWQGINSFAGYRSVGSELFLFNVNNVQSNPKRIAIGSSFAYLNDFEPVEFFSFIKDDVKGAGENVYFTASVSQGFEMKVILDFTGVQIGFGGFSFQTWDVSFYIDGVLKHSSNAWFYQPDQGDGFDLCDTIHGIELFRTHTGGTVTGGFYDNPEGQFDDYSLVTTTV